MHAHLVLLFIAQVCPWRIKRTAQAAITPSNDSQLITDSTKIDEYVYMR